MTIRRVAVLLTQIHSRFFLPPVACGPRTSHRRPTLLVIGPYARLAAISVSGVLIAAVAVGLEHSAFGLTHWLDRFSRLSKAFEAEAVRDPAGGEQHCPHNS